MNVTKCGLLKRGVSEEKPPFVVMEQQQKSSLFFPQQQVHDPVLPTIPVKTQSPAEPMAPQPQQQEVSPQDFQEPEVQQKAGEQEESFEQEEYVPSKGQTTLPEQLYDYSDMFKVIYQTSDVFRAGTDGVFWLYLAETDSCGRITGSPIGGYPIKSEGYSLERGTMDIQEYKTGRHQNSHLLTGGANALIIQKSRSSWYHMVSDSWKPEYITIEYHKEGRIYEKTFEFPKGKKEGWLNDNGFYILHASKKFKYIEGSERMGIENMIGVSAF
ncbi:hypothetical protein QR680_014582 [Steinernema hermaphroditum]|uniref:Uncharacterized protein n=1 Tax=Steinernema hermaphroditum TaxID=289476 RepID=A0AA39M462_9BILA|nr:hypothetical protein QR680_014582 [Steinernema hermaphroditum]